MVRSLWSAATGMNAQQVNVDTIANNLANVNSMGYKAAIRQFPRKSGSVSEPHR